jgi:hypothetical protein
MRGAYIRGVGAYIWGVGAYIWNEVSVSIHVVSYTRGAYIRGGYIRRFTVAIEQRFH